MGSFLFYEFYVVVSFVFVGFSFRSFRFIIRLVFCESCLYLFMVRMKGFVLSNGYF